MSIENSVCRDLSHSYGCGSRCEGASARRCRHAQAVDRWEGYHTDEQVVGYYNTGDRMKYWARLVHSGEAFGHSCSDPRCS